MALSDMIQPQEPQSAPVPSQSMPQAQSEAQAPATPVEAQMVPPQSQDIGSHPLVQLMNQHDNVTDTSQAIYGKHAPIQITSEGHMLDRNGILNDLNSKGYGMMAMDLQKKFVDQDLITQKGKLEYLAAQQGRVAMMSYNLLHNVPEDQQESAYSSMRNALINAGIDPNQLPSKYNKNVVKMFGAMALTAKDQADNELKRYDQTIKDREIDVKKYEAQTAKARLVKEAFDSAVAAGKTQAEAGKIAVDAGRRWEEGAGAVPSGSSMYKNMRKVLGVEEPETAKPGVPKEKVEPQVHPDLAKYDVSKPFEGKPISTESEQVQSRTAEFLSGAADYDPKNGTDMRAMRLAKHLEPGLTDQKIKQRADEAKNFNDVNTPRGKFVNSTRTMLDHAQELVHIMSKIPGIEIQPLQKAYTILANKLGSEEAAKFKTLVSLFSKEAANAVAGGQSTGGEGAEAKENLSLFENTRDSSLAAIKTQVQAALARVDSSQRQLDSVFGDKNKDKYQILEDVDKKKADYVLGAGVKKRIQPKAETPANGIDPNDSNVAYKNGVKYIKHQDGKFYKAK